jgi:prolyl-tRNA editing enzyme YbaK/EbsC (Cys-tRNA(Pro) deacylase)
MARDVCVATEDVTRVLDEAGVNYEVLPHARTESAAAEAKALGIPPGDVAKTLVVKTADGYLRTVMPAAKRLDLHKLREARGGSKTTIQLASEADLARDYAEFELGAVPPIGGGRRDPVVVDSQLARRDSVVLEAGSHEESIRIWVPDLLRVSGAEIADISED